MEEVKMKEKTLSETLVSVIIPVYNVGFYLREALDSVISQTYRHLEILIIDDGSTDQSGAVCDRYAKRDPRIKLYRQENRGLSAARNVGLDHAAGDIIAFLDSDDAYREDAIEKMLHEMYIHQADIVVCGFSCHDTLGHMTPVYGNHGSAVIDRNESYRKIIDRHIDTAPWNRIYKRKIWEDLRFPEGRVFEGTFTVFEVFGRAKKVAVTGDKLVMHRRRPGSICNTYSLKNIEDSYYAARHYLSFVEKCTPLLCSVEKLNRIKAGKIHELITSYFIYIRKEPYDKDGRAALKVLIDRAVEEAGLNKCDLADRAAYYFSNVSPEMAALSYTGLRKAKSFFSK